MTVPDRFKGAVFLPTGIGMLIAAGFVAKSTHEFVQHSQLAAGLVIAESYGPHHVEIRFRTTKGKVVTYHQNGDVTLRTGEVVMVRYDPRDPARDPCVDQFSAIWGTVGFLVFMGSVFAVIGAALLRPVGLRAGRWDRTA